MNIARRGILAWCFAVSILIGCSDIDGARPVREALDIVESTSRQYVQMWNENSEDNVTYFIEGGRADTQIATARSDWTIRKVVRIEGEGPGAGRGREEFEMFSVRMHMEGTKDEPRVVLADIGGDKAEEVVEAMVASLQEASFGVEVLH